MFAELSKLVWLSGVLCTPRKPFDFPAWAQPKLTLSLGVKACVSATQVVKIYSEAEHRRRLLEEVRTAWEELVAVLGDHLELGARGKPQSAEILPLAEALDGRVRHVHQRLREVAANLRKDKAGPREIARGLENVAASIRFAEQRVSSTRGTLARTPRSGKPADAGGAGTSSA